MHIVYYPVAFRDKRAAWNGFLGVALVFILTLTAVHALLDRDINYLTEETLKDVADLNDKDTLMIYQRAYLHEDAAVVSTETMTTITTADQHPGHRETMSLIFETVVTVITHTVIATPAPPSTTAETTTSSATTTSTFSSTHSSVTHTTEKTTTAGPTASDTSSSSSDGPLMTGVMWCLDADRAHDVYTPCPYVHTAVPGMEQAPGMPAIAQKVQTSSASSSCCCKISSFLADPVGTTTRYLARSLARLAGQLGRTALRSLTYLAEKLHPELEGLRQDVAMAEARLHHAWSALGAMPAHYAHAVIVKQEVDADVARAGWAFPSTREDELAAEVGRLRGEVELLRAELDAVAAAATAGGGEGDGEEERKGPGLFDVQLELQVASLMTELRLQRAKYDDCVGYKAWSDRAFVESQMSGGQV
ncbi:hypothetical protein LQW54_005726 [Pestalotiopsis sp. IQ-011]